MPEKTATAEIPPARTRGARDPVTIIAISIVAFAIANLLHEGAVRPRFGNCWRFDAISAAHVGLTAVDRKFGAFLAPLPPSATCPSGTSRPAKAAETFREE